MEEEGVGLISETEAWISENMGESGGNPTSAYPRYKLNHNTPAMSRGIFNWNYVSYLFLEMCEVSIL